MKQILSLLIGVVALITLFLKKAEEKKHEKEALKKEVFNAIDNGDVDTLNALIHHINRL